MKQKKEYQGFHFVHCLCKGFLWGFMEKKIQKLEMSRVKFFEQAGQPNIHHTVLYSKSQKPFSNKNYLLAKWFLQNIGCKMH